MDEKLCIFCKYFIFNLGSADWSELTLGSNPDIDCEKNVWFMNWENVDESVFREILLKAKKCKYYTFFKD